MTTETETKTKSARIAEDVSALIRARHPLLWVVTREEARVEGYLIEAAAAAGYVPRTWDVAQGVCNLAGQPERNLGGQDPGDTLRTIDARTDNKRTGNSERGAWIMRDLPVWLTGGMNTAGTLRQLRNLARSLPAAPRENAQAVIIITPSAEVPPELAGHATVINWPLPDRAEIAGMLDAAVLSVPETDAKTGAPIRANVLASPEAREAAIDGAVGLTGEEAQACFAKSLVQTRTIDPTAVAQEKKRIVERIKGLKWFDPLPGGLDAVGGLDALKAHLVSRAIAWTPEARAYGLPLPVGAFLAGPSGTGKSLTVKAIGTAWQVPIVRVDLGAAKSKFVGESESNLRAAFEVIAALGRCIVWFDEIEKAMSGATDGGADGGVSSDALGFLLTWMQEERGQAFVVATSNDTSKLPPELMRRFDTTWFVDLPNTTERAEIARAAMLTHGREFPLEQLTELGRRTEGFSGAEIAALTDDALYLAYGDGARPVTPADLVTVAAQRRPVSETSPQQIERLRAWVAATNPRRATTPQQTTEGRNAGRKLDL